MLTKGRGDETTVIPFKNWQTHKRNNRYTHICRQKMRFKLLIEFSNRQKGIRKIVNTKSIKELKIFPGKTGIYNHLNINKYENSE